METLKYSVIEGAKIELPNHYFDYLIDFTLTSQQELDLEKNIDQDSYFLLRRMICKSTGAFTVQIKDTDLNYAWSDNVVDKDNAFGTAQWPNYLIDPILLSPNSNIQVKIKDISIAGNAGQLAFSGTRFFGAFPPASVRKARWFQYALTKTLSGNQQTSDVIRINADAKFTIRKLLATSTGAFKTKLSTTQYGSRGWSSDYIESVNQWGTAQRPNLLTEPVMVGRNSAILIDYKDTSTSTNRVQLVFEGVKEWQ